MEQGGKLFTPITDGGMRNLNIEGNLKNQSNVSEGVLTKVEHRKSGDDQMCRISHTLEISFAKQF